MYMNVNMKIWIVNVHYGKTVKEKKKEKGKRMKKRRRKKERE